jgi:putative ABC transport system substrate-binding protein
VQLQLVEVRSPGQLDAAFAAMTTDGAGAAFIAGSDMLFANRARIAELAVKRRLPTTCPLREWVEAGCLICYGTSVSEQWRRAAYFVDRIQKGAKPADLPVEQPTKFDFVINLKTAKALGLMIPQSMLLRADHLIE